MNGSELKQRWKSGRPSLGAWITFSDPAVSALMASLGFDVLFVDGEHMPFNPETLRNVLMILRDRGAVPIVRVRSLDEGLVKQALDWGAEGIMFPFIKTVADARRAAAACHYPPQGVRGYNPRDATNFFLNKEEYVRTANDRVITMLQVEQAEAVENLDEILAVPGVDALMIGPADLSYSLGVPLQTNHPRMQQALNETIQKAQAAGVPVAMTWYDTIEGYREYLKRGLTIVSPYADYNFIVDAAQAWIKRMQND